MSRSSSDLSAGLRAAGTLLAAGRIGLGALYLAAPRSGKETWFGDAAVAPGGPVATRAVGVRELAFGVGTLLALRDRHLLRRWSRLQLPVDVVDLTSTLAYRRQVPRRAAAFASLLAATATVCAAAGATA